MSPLAGSMLTGAVVAGATLIFWGLWALRVGSFTQVPRENGPRVLLMTGFLIALAFFLTSSNTVAGRVVWILIFGVGGLVAWIGYGVQEKKFFGWTSHLIGRTGVIVGLGMALLIGVLAAVVPSERGLGESSWATSSPARCCEYCESRHLCREFDERTSALAVTAAPRARNLAEVCLNDRGQPTPNCDTCQKVGEQRQAAWTAWRGSGTNEPVLQPNNAWSNLLFALAGLLALAARPKEPLAIAFGFSATLLAVGSFLFHASLTGETLQDLDVAGIYGALFAVVIYGIERSASGWMPWRRWFRWVMGGVVVGLSIAFIPLKGPLDAIGSSAMLGIFAAALFGVSLWQLKMTIDDRHRALEEAKGRRPKRPRLTDHSSAHESMTMMLPLFLLVGGLVLRTQDASLEDVQRTLANCSNCPAPTDYGSPGMGMLALFGLLIVIGLGTLLTNVWAIKRQRSGPDWLGAWFVPLWSVLLYALMTIPFLAPLSNCSENGWFNGHTWWHILTASALYMQWRFYDHHTRNTTGDPAL